MRSSDGPSEPESPAVDESADRRRAQRRVPDEVDCLLGKLVDLSQGGAQLLRVGDLDLQQDDRVIVELQTESGQHLGVHARIAWTEEVAHRQHVLGLAFIDLTETDRAALTQLVDRRCSGYDVPIRYLAA